MNNLIELGGDGLLALFHGKNGGVFDSKAV